MQKRLLALVATVAMVLSLFAGVAFAAEEVVKSDARQVGETRIHDLRWYVKEKPLTSVKVKDNTISYYADLSKIEELQGGAPRKSKWIAVGIERPAFSPAFETTVAGYYYTLTREDGTTASGYSGLDSFNGKQGLEWNLDVNEWRTATISVKWLNQHGQQVGVDETFVFNFVDTRLQQVSYPYVGTDGIYADFQVLENGVPADLENYSFSVDDGTAQAGKKGKTVQSVKLAVLGANTPVDVYLKRGSSDVSKLANVSVELSSLPYKVQVTSTKDPIKAGDPVGLRFAFYYLKEGVATLADKFDVEYEGAGLDKTKTTEPVSNTEVLTLTPTKTGTLVLRVTAKTSTDVIVGTDTVELKVVGFNMTVEPKSVLVDKAGTLTIVLKDQDGNPINGADIVIGELDAEGAVITERSETYTNLQLKPNNGVYEISYKKDAKFITTAGTKKVIATFGSEKVEANLLVMGEEAYTVTSNLTKDVLAGQKTQVTLQVKEGNTVIFPTSVKILDDENTVLDTVPTLRSGNNVVVTIPALDEAGEYTLLVESADGKKVGKLTFDVQLPVLKLSAEKVTNNVISNFTVELLDPTDGYKPLQWLLKVDAQHAAIHSLKLADKAVFGGYLGRLEKYDLSVLVTANYDAAEAAKKVAGLVFTATGDDDVEFDVVAIADAELVADPATMAVGQKGIITLTLVDANGAPLAGYTVLQGTTKFTTAEDGVVEYEVARMAADIKFVANLDAKDDDDPYTVEKTVKMTLDTLPPYVHYEEVVNTNKTSIVIGDNVRLARVRIDGKEIDLFGRNPYEHEVTLVPGINKFYVEALDAENNLFAGTVTIEYKTNSVKLEGETVKRQGDFLFVQLRQFEELGAQIAWNQATRTATFVVGDTKVEITVGSTTAMVNGQAVTMPVAAFIDAALGRTYVPVRFVSEALGWNVHWAQGDIVTITLP